MLADGFDNDLAEWLDGFRVIIKVAFTSNRSYFTLPKIPIYCTSRKTQWPGGL